jgi:asparaginyl-tRNA synthetase
MQVVIKQNETQNFEELKSARTGSSVLITGQLKSNDNVDGKYEIIASEGKLLRQADENYPLQKKQHSLEFLREIAHLRPRTKTFNAIMSVRNKLAYEVHNFFQNEGFL